MPDGFILHQEGNDEKPHYQGSFAVWIDQNNVVVNHSWFRAGWFDAATLAWKDVAEGRLVEKAPVAAQAPGASLFVPIILAPGEENTIKLLFAWYVPKTDLRIGKDPADNTGQPGARACCASATYVSWYAFQFKNIKKVVKYWRCHYDNLRQKSALFRDAFYRSTLPPEVVKAVAANLTILKSPTV